MDHDPQPSVGLAPDDLTCQALVELITGYLDGALDPAVRARFEAHLAACPPCQDYLEQFRRTVAVVGRLGVEPVAPAERARLLSLFRGWRNQAPG